VVRLTAADRLTAAAALETVPDGALVLVDGLVAGWAADELAEAGARIRVVVLAHMVAASFPDASPQVVQAERRAVGAAHRVIATSRWTADELVRSTPVPRDRVTVAVPGVHPAAPAEPRSDGELLCVGVIAPHKGQDLLLDALARVIVSDWTCTLVGSATAFGDFAERIAQRAEAFDGRVRMPGVLTPDDLAGVYRRTALLVAPSRVESSGMAIVEARARGIPVLGSRVGGIPEVLAGGGGVLLPADEVAPWADALNAWLVQQELRERLRHEACRARAALPSWPETVTVIERTLVAA
jgi:glycosyltransferase involved in cell wall biosynthesis